MPFLRALGSWSCVGPPAARTKCPLETMGSGDCSTSGEHALKKKLFAQLFGRDAMALVINDDVANSTKLHTEPADMPMALGRIMEGEGEGGGDGDGDGDGMFALMERAAKDWTFSTFELDRATDGHALSCLAMHLIKRSGIERRLGLSPSRLAAFLVELESGYLSSNPYHNAVHAADVLRSMHRILHMGGLEFATADPVCLLACYTAAACHDFKHLGVTNDFLVGTAHDLALTYNDKSPMEMHHIAETFRLLKNPHWCFFEMSPEDFGRFRTTVIDLVLSTDMREHFDVLRQAKAAASGEAANSRPNSRQLDEHRMLLLKLALKASDIGHVFAPFDVHLEWVQRLQEEFFVQGDREKALNIHVTSMCDRLAPGIMLSQDGFFKMIAIPLMTSLADNLPATSALHASAVENLARWKAALTGPLSDLTVLGGERNAPVVPLDGHGGVCWNREDALMISAPTETPRPSLSLRSRGAPTATAPALEPALV